MTRENIYTNETAGYRVGKGVKPNNRENRYCT